MAKSNVYDAFEVRDGFGPHEVGGLELRTASRAEAEARIEDMWTHGSCVQLFGIRTTDVSGGGEVRVLLRCLAALRAA